MCSQQHGTNIDEREEKVMTIEQESQQFQQQVKLQVCVVGDVDVVFTAA